MVPLERVCTHTQHFLFCPSFKCVCVRACVSTLGLVFFFFTKNSLGPLFSMATFPYVCTPAKASLRFRWFEPLVGEVFPTFSSAWIAAKVASTSSFSRCPPFLQQQQQQEEKARQKKANVHESDFSGPVQKKSKRVRASFCVRARTHTHTHTRARSHALTDTSKSPPHTHGLAVKHATLKFFVSTSRKANFWCNNSNNNNSNSNNNECF